MDTGKAEYDILKLLVYTFCFSIIVGLIGVCFGKVDPQFVEGLITGGLLTLITNMFKDLSAKNISTPAVAETPQKLEPAQGA